MALTMLDKAAEKKDNVAVAGRYRRRIRARERRIRTRASAPRCCRKMNARACGSSASPPASASASTATCSIISGPRSTAAVARQHVHDGTTVEYTYAPGETRHESYGKGEFKVHDLENLGDRKWSS